MGSKEVKVLGLRGGLFGHNSPSSIPVAFSSHWRLYLRLPALASDLRLRQPGIQLQQAKAIRALIGIPWLAEHLRRQHGYLRCAVWLCSAMGYCIGRCEQQYLKKYSVRSVNLL